MRELYENVEVPKVKFGLETWVVRQQEQNNPNKKEIFCVRSNSELTRLERVITKNFRNGLKMYSV